MHQNRLHQITQFILLSYVDIVRKLLISRLLVPVKTSQSTSTDVYDSREIRNNIYHESSYISNYHRSPFNVESNTFNALLGIGRAWLVDADQILWKTSTWGHNAMGLGGLKRWTGLTAQYSDDGFGPTWSKIQSTIEQ
jgi:hypothetical protein